MPSPFVLLVASLPLIFRLVPMVVPSHLLEPYNLWSPVALNTKPGVKWRNFGYWADTTDYSEAAEALARRLLDSVGDAGAGGNVLDIAHGAGESLCLHLSRSPPPAHLYALTSLPQETELARALVSAQYGNSTTRVEFFTASASFKPGTDLRHPLNPMQGFMGESRSASPADDSTEVQTDFGHLNKDEDVQAVPSPPPYDLVYILDAIYHFPPSIPHFLASTLKVLAPGGTIVYTDVLPPAHINAGLAHLVLPWLLGVPAKNLVQRPKSLDEYEALLQRIGYEDVEIQDWSGAVWSGFAGDLNRRGMGWKVVARAVRWAEESGWRVVAVRARRPGLVDGEEGDHYR